MVKMLEDEIVDLISILPFIIFFFIVLNISVKIFRLFIESIKVMSKTTDVKPIINVKQDNINKETFLKKVFIHCDKCNKRIYGKVNKVSLFDYCDECFKNLFDIKENTNVNIDLSFKQNDSDNNLSEEIKQTEEKEIKNEENDLFKSILRL